MIKVNIITKIYIIEQKNEATGDTYIFRYVVFFYKNTGDSGYQWYNEEN